MHAQASRLHLKGIQRRQDVSNNGLPTLTTESRNAPSTTVTSSESTPPGAAASSDEPYSASTFSSATITSSSSSTSRALSTLLSATISTSTSSVSQTHHATPTPTQKPNSEAKLPVIPKITPALSIGGVILILTGLMYALVGVKNKWLQIFLSAAYLSSLSITILVDYVMDTPVSNAIQGAYFVGIFMSGLIFGAGALIFKDITEGLGCLLGGFCLSMWILTLTPGGLITSTSGKAILIGVFCVLAWSASFSHYTRAYGIIGSTSFTGSTTFVLGIDCFARAGLKEFWFYIWGLNDDLFPLNTYTYPITRGMRVETVVIVLACMVGILSQLRLWKVVQDHHRKRQEARQDNERQRDIVEAALGRQLERQNHRDRSEWERQYGDDWSRSKRNTVSWSEAHSGKRYSNVAVKEVKKQPTSNSSSSDNLEMVNLSLIDNRSPYGSRSKRQSTLTVQAILEVEEDEATHLREHRQHAAHALEGQIRDGKAQALSDAPISPALAPQSHNSDSDDGTWKGGRSADQMPAITHDSIPAVVLDEIAVTSSLPKPRRNASVKKKRRSIQSLLSRASHATDDDNDFSESREALVSPDFRPISRASSLAATLDGDTEQYRDKLIADTIVDGSPPAQHHVSSISFSDNMVTLQGGQISNIREVPPSPPALVEVFDPEELSRPPIAVTGKAEHREDADASSREGELPSGSQVRSPIPTSQASMNDGLTRDALEQMPTQFTDVALSYRTNEWAKHIATADAPIFEEPEPMFEAEDEQPARLKPVLTSGIVTDPMSSALSTAPDPPSIVVVTPSSHRGTKIALPKGPSVSSRRTSQSNIAPRTSLPLNDSAKRGVQKNFRSSSTPIVGQSLQGTAIDENVETNFSSQGTQQRSLVEAAMPVSSRHSIAGGVAVEGAKVPTLDGTRQPYVHEPGTGTSLYFDHSALAPRYTSQRHGGAVVRPDTRLSSYDSHQPHRRTFSDDAQRREMLLAEWRMSQQQRRGAYQPAESRRVMSLPVSQAQRQDKYQSPKMELEARRAQMMADKQHSRILQQQQEYAHQHRQQALDQVMRRADMQQLHREAIRKMQASAYKQL